MSSSIRAREHGLPAWLPGGLEMLGLGTLRGRAG